MRDFFTVLLLFYFALFFIELLESKGISEQNADSGVADSMQGAKEETEESEG